MSTRFSRFIMTFAVILVSFPVSAARAADLLSSGPVFSWNDSAHRACGQACLYEKANENFSLQALFILKKIAKVKDLVANGKETQARDDLFQFCVKSETTQECVDRYVRSQIPVLQRLKAGMLADSNAVAELRGSASLVQQTYVVAQNPQGASPDENSKLPQTPSLATYEELQAQYKAESYAINAANTNTFDRWARSVPAKPSPDDFVQFKDIPRDADKPKGEKLSVVVTDGRGYPMIDRKAYAVALKKWEDRRADLQRDYQLLMKEHPSHLDHVRAADLNPSVVGDDGAALYNDARGLLVQTANMAIVGGRQQGPPPAQLNFPGPAGRAPAAGPSAAQADTHNTEHFTGKEQVLPVLPGSERSLAVTIPVGDLAAQIEAMQ